MIIASGCLMRRTFKSYTKVLDHNIPTGLEEYLALYLVTRSVYVWKLMLGAR